jgi:metal-responsive CopG/Arc/MetJ family transcriptional regulator
MANTGITIDDEVLEEFDRVIDIKHALGHIETDNRSKVIEQLMIEYIEENHDLVKQFEGLQEGNSEAKTTTVTAD